MLTDADFEVEKAELITGSQIEYFKVVLFRTCRNLDASLWRPMLLGGNVDL